MLNYVVALTSENWVDISTSISTRPWTNHRSLWPRQTSCKHIKSNMADASSAILFIIGLRRAGIENWVKYAILRVRMSLRVCLYASENQALACIVCAWRRLGRVKKKNWPIADRHVPSNDPRTHFGLPHAYCLTRIVFGSLAQILFILIGYLHAIAVAPWKLQRLLLSFHKIPFNTGSERRFRPPH